MLRRTVSGSAGLVRPLAVSALMVATILSAAACSSDRRVRASFQVAADTLEVYPFTTSAAGAPTTVAVAFQVGAGVIRGLALPADGSGQYDIAFDINSSDNTILLRPVRTILSPVSGAPQVGLRPVSDPFESITSAPDEYYRPDTATTVNIGQTVLFVTYRRVGGGSYGYGGTLCDIVATPRVFGKMVVDSVRGSTIYFRQVVNPNCGYRSLTPGFPSF